jgi:hypothetical protein
MNACGSCALRGDERQRRATTGDATTSRQTRGKREERRQWTRGNGASIGRVNILRFASSMYLMRYILLAKRSIITKGFC